MISQALLSLSRQAWTWASTNGFYFFLMNDFYYSLLLMLNDFYPLPVTSVYSFLATDLYSLRSSHFLNSLWSLPMKCLGSLLRHMEHLHSSQSLLMKCLNSLQRHMEHLHLHSLSVMHFCSLYLMRFEAVKNFFSSFAEHFYSLLMVRFSSSFQMKCLYSLQKESPNFCRTKYLYSLLIECLHSFLMKRIFVARFSPSSFSSFSSF
mmetsp:Transcript_6042/g.9376  ORF Transcript_6042/g.9376 Transcript_6042/m.9376 type:complete len:206 (+) Transcript_6042:541-1158(+)